LNETIDRSAAVEAILRPLKAAGDRSRLRLLRILARGTFSVAELTEILGIGQSTVSKHLRVLADAGLVSVRRSGTWGFYGLSPRDDHAFDGRLLELLGEALDDAGENGDAAAVERVLARHRRARSEFFRDAASRWDHVRDTALGPPAHLDRLVELAGRGGTAVDLGTGTGVLLQRLARVSERVIGIDASPEMLEEATRRAEQEEIVADLRLGALEHLPLSDGEADTMVANLVLHHVAEPVAVFREIRRGLAPGGRLVIAELDEHDDPSFWRGLGARWPGFRPEEMRDCLQAAGYRGVRTEISAPANGEVEAERRPRVFLVEARRSD
jgi:ArsR family transcriptional regulator